ncbi:serine/threonine protein kinase Japonica Group [Alternaria sp. MG1]|nr:serine/threonine protein kinase Japonica Group [Alternaria sp. MG1]
MEEFDWIKSFAESSYGSVSDPVPPPVEPTESKTLSATTPRGSFASFVCHVTSLEHKLRSFSPIVLDDSSVVRNTGKILGQGKTFMVKHAQWIRDVNEPPLDVAVKEIIPDARATNQSLNSSTSSSGLTQNDWKEILFEIRALLHEPIRYHPNIIRLLGIQWGLSPISESTYPVLIMEYASLGTFATLQASSEPLSFAAKQKLCYDVGRGLSALHACGIVHGDMKHENVLIVPAKEPLDGISYTAKLADFGGAVMNMTPNEFRKMETWTWPFQAPEVTSNQRLSKDGMVLTDVYAFGLLVWRAFEDGQGFVSLPGAAQDASDEDKRSLSARKASQSFTASAVASIHEYASMRGMSQRCVNTITYTILHTVRLEPEDRDLVMAQAALRGLDLGHIPKYLRFIKKKNEELAASETGGPPGKHGIARDGAALFLGRYGNDIDLQHNIPGFRPRLNEPNPEEVLFEPERLKKILTWNQQRQILDELKATANDSANAPGDLIEMNKTVAAFHVFQCYLLEFGTKFNADETVQWLSKASSHDDSHDDADYLAQAWIWRISRALEVNVNLIQGRLESLLRISVMRGHWSCLQDVLELINTSTGATQQQWSNKFQQFRNILLSQMGAVGMGYFFSPHMTPPWNRVNLRDISQLDETIAAILGDTYDSCLRVLNSQLLESSTQEYQRRGKTAFDQVYVNIRGHGPLHYAAASGNLNALRHMIEKYDCDMNLPNQHVDETPLVCACSGGRLDCALLLLDKGADANGYHHGQEGPLHWLCSFLPNEMEIIASALVKAGADIELRSGGMRADVRGIRADWEHIFETKTTPLGRAVLMNSLPAVKVLLRLGADPLKKSADKHPGEWKGDKATMVDISSPFELAAALTLPEILAEFITHIDGPTGAPRRKLPDVSSVVDLARGKKVTKFDPLSLRSRLVRHGHKYKNNLRFTWMILHARSIPFQGAIPTEELQKVRSRTLCDEVAHGNLDIVECLLQLGYSASGTSDHRPLQKAIELNHEEMFELLIRYRADTSVTTTTPAGNISLLHICASRPRQSRPGRYIADALIIAGVPIESTDRRVKPPLALAVLNQNFDVAQALIDNNADVDAVYPLEVYGLNGPETKSVSVLVEILSQHTNRTLESLKFLFGKRDGGPAQRPAFYVDLTSKLTILHLLAGSPNYTQIGQITPKILNLCLEMYWDDELINCRHPLLGTALYHAATNGNKAMVERLLQYGADETYAAGPDVDGSVQNLFRSRYTWTPLWAAILRLDEELKKGVLFPPDETSGTWLNSNIIQNLEKIVTLLSSNDKDDLAQQAVEQIRTKMEVLQAEFVMSRIEKAKAKREGKIVEEEHPADLGILSGKSGEIDEKIMREICTGLEDEWTTGEVEAFLESLQL